MNSIQHFKFEGAEVRVEDRGGDLWFIASDAAQLLGYRDAANLAQSLDADERGTCNVSTQSGAQKMIAITEPGLYRATMQRRVSKKLSDEKRQRIARFQRWVYHDVLPAIRKTGSYSLHPDVTVTELDPAVRSTLGGMIKRNAGVVVREELAPVHADLDALRKELADFRATVRPGTITRHGVTAKTLWDGCGLPQLKNGTLWLGNRLVRMGAAVEGGLRGEVRGNPTRLFDPDKAKHCLDNGLLNTARAYIAERQGQGKLRLVSPA